MTSPPRGTRRASWSADPAGCRAELAARAADPGVSYFFCRFGDLATLERFGEEVMREALMRPAHPPHSPDGLIR